MKLSTYYTTQQCLALQHVSKAMFDTDLVFLSTNCIFLPTSTLLEVIVLLSSDKPNDPKPIETMNCESEPQLYLFSVRPKPLIWFRSETQTQIGQYRIVASRSTCYYSENQIFYFLKSRILTCRIYFLGTKLFYLWR